jgi:hypothetical protein
MKDSIWLSHARCPGCTQGIHPPHSDSLTQQRDGGWMGLRPPPPALTCHVPPRQSV